MKSEEKYKDKLKKLKTEKRKACKSIKDGVYGRNSNNTKIKKIKEGFKAERRSIKRGEKNLVMKYVEEEIINVSNKESVCKKKKTVVKEMFPFNYFRNE